MKCSVCGNQGYRLKYFDTCSDECFNKAFWNEKVQWREDGDIYHGSRAVRINHTHYLIGPEPVATTYRPSLGFGGQRFVISFQNGPHKGTKVTTHNLTCQGTIPESYREQLPDNAVFLDTAETGAPALAVDA